MTNPIPDMVRVFLAPHPQAELAPGAKRLAWIKRVCREELPAKTQLEIGRIQKQPTVHCNGND